MDWYLVLALALIAAGFVLLLAEFFAPTGGLLVVAGVLLLAVSVGVVLLYGTTTEALAVAVAVAVGGPVAGWRLTSLYERRMTSGLLKVEPEADPPLASGLEKYRGRFGRTVTPMRPAGAVEIDGRRVDAVSEGPMIDAAVGVKCVAVRFGTPVVRPVDAPTGLDDLPADALG